jgi:hypothetical protein
MRKGSMFSTKFWDSDLHADLPNCPPGCIWVALHLMHGPGAEVSSIYRISIGQMAEDCHLTADEVRACLTKLVATGWCEYAHPIVWVRGYGNINDKLGTSDFRANPSWVKATQKHLEALPSNPVVERFRAYYFDAPPVGRGEGVHREEGPCRQGGGEGVHRVVGRVLPGR